MSNETILELHITPLRIIRLKFVMNYYFNLSLYTIDLDMSKIIGGIFMSDLSMYGAVNEYLNNDSLFDSKKKGVNKKSYISDFFVPRELVEEKKVKKKGKKKKKKVNMELPEKYRGEYNPADFSLKQMRGEADSIESYLNIINSFAIIKGISPEQYKEAVKKVKELIKYLREGKYWKVYRTKDDDWNDDDDL